MALIVFFSDLSGVRRWPLICVDWLLLPCKFVAAWQRRVVVLAATARSTLPCSPGEHDQVALTQRRMRATGESRPRMWRLCSPALPWKPLLLLLCVFPWVYCI